MEANLISERKIKIKICLLFIIYFCVKWIAHCKFFKLFEIFIIKFFFLFASYIHFIRFFNNYVFFFLYILNILKHTLEEKRTLIMLMNVNMKHTRSM